MSKRLADKLCERLLKSAPSQASTSGLLWGETAIPESMKKTKLIGKQPKEKNC